MTEQMINQMFTVLAAIRTQGFTIAEITAKYAAYGEIVIDAAYQEYENETENEGYEGEE